MAKSVKPIPDGYHSVTPYLIIGRGKASEAIDFYTRAFNAKEIMRMPGPEGGIAHAEIQLGDSRIMLADEAPKIEAYGPDHFNGSPITLLVYVPDVDATAKQATAAGATVSPAYRRPVLWRPDRRFHRSFWSPVVFCNPHPRRIPRRRWSNICMPLHERQDAETAKGLRMESLRICECRLYTGAE